VTTTTAPETDPCDPTSDRKKSAAVALMAARWPPAAIAEALGVSERTVYRWSRELRDAVRGLAG
jgi:transposase-like protein